MTKPQDTGGECTKPSVRVRAAAIIVRDDSILLVRHEKDGQSYWLLPGGGCEYGETVAEALVRELKEETGLDIHVRDLVIVNDSIPPDGHRHVLNLCFTADIAGGEIVCQPDERLREAQFVKVDRLPDLTLFPDIRDILISDVRRGFPDHARYLGNLWKDVSSDATFAR